MSLHPKRCMGQVPDHILCHILSLLPSKDAARTSVLSKRWRHLFLHVPKLIAVGRQNAFGGVWNTEVNQEMLLFINRWIMSSVQLPVDEFRLKTTYFPEESVFYLWLTTLLLRRVKILELESGGYMRRPPRLLFPPEEFFRSETLVTLIIKGNAFVLKIPDFICYPSLKILHLEDLHVVDESGHFMFTDAGFPRLEEFCLNCVYFILSSEEDVVEEFKDVESTKEDVKEVITYAETILTISLATLKKLVIDYDTSIIGRVDIDTQRLEHFQFTVETDLDMEVNFSKCESLVYAEILQFDPEESYIKFLSQINNVKTLRLSDRTPDNSPRDHIGFAVPRFLHLAHLKVLAHQSVWILLHQAPNLEVLDFRLSYKYEDYLPPEDVPQCLLHSLKEIRITAYKWYEDTMEDDDIEDDDEVGSHAEIVQYFLQHGAVLQRMSLGHSTMKTAEWRQTTLDLFRNVDRISQNCEIDLKEQEY